MYTMKDEELSDLPEVTQRLMKIGTLPLVFREVPSSVIEVLKETSLQALPTQGMEIEDIGNVVALEVESSRGSTTVCESFHRGVVRFFTRAALALSTATKEFSESDVGIGMGNKKNQIVSRRPIAPPLKVDVKVEDVVDENVSGSGSELRSTRRNSYEQLQNVIKSPCVV